ncbi:MAG: OpgC domain-containing protein [Pseudomonadota bacterium]
MSRRQFEKPAMRDPRLDFFRGIGMFIIFIAHVPSNAWTLYIPARFGFSDATEVFVFCSGMASAIAFGKVYSERGWLLGTSRILFRTWQVYWVHLALFLFLLTLMCFFDSLGVFEKSYVSQLNLHKFLENPQQNLIGLMTLTYVPNYFDILPMYIGILLMVPIIMALRKFGVLPPLVFMFVLWLSAQFSYFQLPAEPWSDRAWFFNPFGWQLIFFTGFAFMAGWIKPPPVNKYLITLSAIILIITIPLAFHKIIKEVVFIQELRRDYDDLIFKTNLGVLRYIHFLALSYICWVLAGPGGQWLQIKKGIASYVIAIIHKVGQQALSTFIAGMVMAQVFGVFLDVTGRTALTYTIANFGGFICLIITAYVVSWFKSQPWKIKHKQRLKMLPE